MDIRDIFEGKAQEGFFLTAGSSPPVISKEQRAALIRKGNELYNRGDLATARRIFLTARYGDGLIRMGDHYYKKREPLEAFRMYWLAKEKVKSDILIEKMAAVIRDWLDSEDNQCGQETERRV
jgi:hypothetical protein